MAHGAVSVFNASIASGATLSAAFELQRTWTRVYLPVPTMTSNTQFHIQASETSSGFFRRLKMSPVSTTTVAALPDFYIHSSNTNCMVPIPGGLRYVKIETTATVDSGQSFNLICSD